LFHGQANEAGEAVLTLQIRGYAGAGFATQVVIDTGFSGHLALPQSLLESAGYQSDSQTSVIMADGSTILCDTYTIEIEWDGAWRWVTAWPLGNLPLLGSDMLRDYQLQIDYKHAGGVEIQKL
jgi:clan AA aspartic protease